MKKIMMIAITGLVLTACNNNGTGTTETDTTTTYDNTQNADTSIMRDTSMTDTMHLQNDTMPRQ
jgi:protein involved in sex pheromone biosynthesis